MSRRAPGSRLSSGGGGGTKYPRSWNDWQPRWVSAARPPPRPPGPARGWPRPKGPRGGEARPRPSTPGNRARLPGSPPGRPGRKAAGRRGLGASPSLHLSSGLQPGPRAPAEVRVRAWVLEAGWRRRRRPHGGRGGGGGQVPVPPPFPKLGVS
jgi:hypothetical protein